MEVGNARIFGLTKRGIKGKPKRLGSLIDKLLKLCFSLGIAERRSGRRKPEANLKGRKPRKVKAYSSEATLGWQKETEKRSTGFS